MKVDRVQAQSMGLSLSDVYTAIQLMLAPVYVDDFVYGGRVLRVNMQADAAFRANPDALSHFYVPSKMTCRPRGRMASRRAASTKNGNSAALDSMVPLSNVVQTNWILDGLAELGCATTATSPSISSAAIRRPRAPARRWR